MHILIISHFYPPLNVIASLRPYSFAKTFAENNIEVTVITTKKSNHDGYLDLKYGLIEGVNVIEISYLPLFFWKKRNKLSEDMLQNNPRKTLNKKSKNKLKEFIKSIAYSFGSLLDHQLFWINKAFLTAKKIDDKKMIDIVISIYSPMASHVVAYKLKKHKPAIKWIADYRDLWSINYLGTGKGVFNRIEKLIERKVINEASCLTTVSEPLAEQLKEFTKNLKPVSVIYNGHDNEENYTIKPSFQLKKPIRIIYTGTIYNGNNNPTPLFKALNLLEKEGGVKCGEILIEFYGSLLGNLEEIIEECNASKWVIIKGHVPHVEIIQIQKESDFLLFLWSNGGKTDGVLSGKIFEYICSNKPILAINIDNKSSVAELIIKTQTGYFFEGNINLIKEFLKKIIKNPNRLEFNPKWEIIEEYSRKKQALKLLGIANSLYKND